MFSELSGVWHQVLILDGDAPLYERIRTGTCQIENINEKITFRAHSIKYLSNIQSSFWISEAVLRENSRLIVLYQYQSLLEKGAFRRGLMEFHLYEDGNTFKGDRFDGMFWDLAPAKNFGTVCIFKEEDTSRCYLDALLRYQKIQKVDGKVENRTIQVFISYSRKDENWLNSFKMQFTPLLRNHKLSVWDDTCIQAGDEWRTKIHEALVSSEIAVLLVSPNFLASDFIANRELLLLLDAAKNRKLKIIWIPISHSLCEETEISQYQAIHPSTKPLDSLSSSEQNKAWVDICRNIMKVISNT